ncbi:MAG: enoyl-CoA hydratase/isomerase family protein [Actinomycetota bacterium]|nr:MAG: enoyl-CoA hydratase/isomerase family protein [Actinomycetota bacterium]
MTQQAGPGAVDDDLLSGVERGVGRIVLNRPKAMNAITTPMAAELDRLLAVWGADPGVRAVVISGAGERGLCAGGDVRAMWESSRGDGVAAREFFRTEYRMNVHFAQFGKPILALMDGVVLGGGLGVSGHASVRVVTERSYVGMPEVTIGFVPDVGGTYLLSRAPGRFGSYLAMTGVGVGPADAITCGLADYHVPADRLDDLVAAVVGGADPAAAAANLATAPVEGELPSLRAWIDSCFAAPSAVAVVAALRAATDPRAVATAELIETKSPIAVAVALESIRRAAALPDLAAVIEQEFRVSCAFTRSHDLVEGIRAQVVDRDRSPRWSPPRLSDVSPEDVASYFADRGDGTVLGPR